MVDSRNKFVELRTQLKNKVHNLLNRCGIKIKKTSLSSQKGLNKALSYEVDELVRFELEQLIAEIKTLIERIDQFDNKMAEFRSKLPGFENVTSIKGVGTNTAVTLLSSIGNINNFADEKKLAAYFGLVPRVSNSNETVNHSRITKRGDSLVRKLLTIVYYTLKKGWYFTDL